MQKLIIIDGYATYYRAYYAFARNPLINAKGEETSVIFGFFKILFNLLSARDFDYIILAQDSKGPTLRHELYKKYKANRPPMPDSLKEQINYLQKQITYLGLPQITMSGYEADDIIATLATKAETQDIKTEIFTSDKDLMQIVSKKVELLSVDRKTGDLINKNIISVKEKWGVEPKQMGDLLALMGDASDNIPGVKGIGEKTAASLLQEYKNLDDIYMNLDKIKSKTTKKKLEEDKEMAYLSKKLVTLQSNVPNIKDISFYQLKPINQLKLMEGLKEKELFSIIEKIPFNKNQENIYLHSFLSKNQKKKSLDVFANKKKETGFKQNHLTEKNFAEIISVAKKNKQMTFDLETTSLDPFDAKLVAIVFAFPDFSSYYCRVKTKEKNIYPAIHSYLKSLLEDASIKKVGHNLKFEYMILKQLGINLKGIYFDTMLGEYLLNSNRTHFNLESLVLSYFDIQKETYLQMQGKAKTIFDISEDILANYTFQDGEYTQLIFEKQIKCFKKKELYLMNNLEMPLIEVLGEIETNGVLLDVKSLEKLSYQNQKELNSLVLQIHHLAGKSFNINSTKKLQSILFGEMGIKPIKKVKTGYSTDITVLEKLAKKHPIADALLRYRLLNKLKSTYIDSLPKLINKKTGRVHTNYNQSVAATGRLSSNKPNLQNIPIKMKEGREIRECFIAPKNHIVASFDYSQVELRVLAKLSGDKNLLEAYRQKIDIHEQTAKILFNTMSVDSDQRRIAKTINFSVMYGISAFALAEDLKIDRKEAVFFIEAYFEAYPGVRKYIDKIIELTQKKQYTLTYYGRKRNIPEILSTNLMQKSHAERVAFNSVIQGTASDIIKIAMIEVNKQLKNKSLIGQMIMQVHDELVFYLPNDKNLNEQKKKIKETMSSVKPFTDILTVNEEIGLSWAK